MINKLKHFVKKNQFYLYIAPWFIAFILFTCVPMLVSLVLSFTTARVSTLSTRPLRFVGLMNYIDIFTKDDLFIRSILNTFVYALAKVVFTIVCAFLIALFLNRRGKWSKWKNFYRVLIYLPAMIPAVSSALLWQILVYQDRSFIVNLFQNLGFGKLEFGRPSLAMVSVVVINSLGMIGPWMITILAGLQNVPQDLIEASQIDGASKFKQLIHIVIPMLSPVLFFLLATGFINTLQAYAEISLLIQENFYTYTMSMVIVNNAFSGTGIGYASSLAWISFILIGIFTVIFFKTVGKRVYYEGK